MFSSFLSLAFVFTLFIQNLAGRHARITLDCASGHVSNTAGLAQRDRASPSILVGFVFHHCCPKRSDGSKPSNSPGLWPTEVLDPSNFPSFPFANFPSFLVSCTKLSFARAWAGQWTRASQAHTLGVSSTSRPFWRF